MNSDGDKLAWENGLWLKPVHPEVRPMMLEALEEGDVEQFLVWVENQDRLFFLFMNQGALRERGLYEEALFQSFVGVGHNNKNVPQWGIDSLFSNLDRDRLRAAGDPLPGPGPFTLYRGVAGKGPARRVRGYSWTASRNIAWCFAKRYAKTSLETCTDPAVFKVAVDAEDVLAYTNDLDEEEFIVKLPDSANPVRVPADTCPPLADEQCGDEITFPDLIRRIAQ